MKTYIKQILLRGLGGSVIGLAIGHTIYFAIALQGQIIQVEAKDVIINYIACLLVGFWCSAVSVVYNIEEWSLLRQTITHGILLLPYMPFAFFMGWAPATFVGRVGFVIFYILVYVVIWINIKNYWTKKANELNDIVKQINLD